MNEIEKVAELMLDERIKISLEDKKKYIEYIENNQDVFFDSGGEYFVSTVERLKRKYL